jgi:hypothetical protein
MGVGASKTGIVVNSVVASEKSLLVGVGLSETVDRQYDVVWGLYRDLRRSEGIAETPALSEGQLFSYVVVLASEPSTVRVLAS